MTRAYLGNGKRATWLAILIVFSGLILAGCGDATNTPAQPTTLAAALTTTAVATTVAATTTVVTTAVATTSAATTTAVPATTTAVPATTTSAVITTAIPATTTSAVTTVPATTVPANTTSAAAVPTGVPPVVTPPSGGATLSGRVFDRDKKVPLPGAIVVAGYETIKRATIADSQGNYSFKGIPATKNFVVVSFLAGYTYLFQTIDLNEGQNAKLDIGIIVQPDPQMIPTLSDMKISTDTAKPGDEVTFSMTVKMSAASKVPLSNEIMVMNPSLNKSVLMQDTGGGHYVGKFQLPTDTALGVYPWTFFATDEACREPDKFPVLNLTVNK